MLFITGVLALAALCTAGGDHTKGGGHVKGGAATQSGSTLRFAQEHVAAASPYSLNIDADAAYGARIFREEKSDADGRVKGGSASVLIPIPVEDAVGSAAVGKKSVISAGSTLGKTRFDAPAPLFRDPIALPVANQPAITTVKTVKTIASASGQQSIKTVEKVAQPVVVTQEKIQPVVVAPVRSGSGDILPGPLVSSGQLGGAREVIVYDDGTIVDVGSVSGDAGFSASADLQPLIGGISGGPVLKAGGQLSGGAREVIVYEDGTIEEVGGASGDLGQVDAKSGSGVPGNIATVTTAQRTVIRTGPKPDLKVQRRPIASFAPVVSTPKVKPFQVAPKPGLSDELIKINRELIQRQNQQGFIQTFEGVVKPDSNLEDISISLSDLSHYSSEKPVDAPAPKKAIFKAQKPKLERPRVTPIVSAPKPKVSVQSPQVTSINENIKLINQQLIQRQNQEGVLQTFGGVANSESDLTGLSVSLEQISGYGPSQPIAPTTEFKRPVALPKTPKASTLANRGQTFSYTGNRVTSGILGPSVPRKPSVGSSQFQGNDNQFVIGNAAGSFDSNENIKLINRQLIQRQNEEGVLQTFGGVAKSESDLTGLPISLEQLGGYGARSRPVAPAIQLRQPAPVAKPKIPNRIVGSTASRDQIFKYTGTRVTSGILGPSAPRIVPGQSRVGISQNQRYNNQNILRNAAGSINSNDNLKLINRQLIQRQNEEGVLQTFGGVAKTESELTGVAVSLSEVGDLSKPKQAPQIRKPVAIRDEKLKYTGTRTTSGQVSGSTGTRVIPSQIVFGNAAGSIGSTRIGTQQVSAPKPKISSQAGLSDNIKLINRQLIQKQSEEGFSQTFGGIVKSDSDIGRVSITLDQLGGISQLSGYNVNRPAVPAIQSTGSVRRQEQKFKNTATRIVPVDPSARASPIPISTIQEQIIPQSNDIITLNRGLIQKQNEEGVLQTFGGIVKSEADLDGIAVSLEDLGGLTQIGSYGAYVPQTPPAPKRPAIVVPNRPSSIVSSQVSRQPTATRAGQRTQEVGIRSSDAQRFAPARISPQNTAGRTTSAIQRTATRSSSDIGTTASRGTTTQISRTSGTSVARQPAYSQAGLSDELININRQLIAKQNREGLQQTFGGLIKSEEDLAGGPIYVDELDAITKLVGYNTGRDQGPPTYGYSLSSGQRNSAAGGNAVGQTTGGSYSLVEQSQIATGLIPADSPDIYIAGKGDEVQLQVKIESIDEPSSLSQVKDTSNIPSIQALIPQPFKQVDLQENIPIEISSYSPPLRPYNYRTQIRASSSDSPHVQEQQKLEQILL